mmetsp:Transcript_73646/g.158008  ORF Transcript_73646/g.158008 Transcript_73646/m.158008 type:complete len:255 (-) Transcript_73646:12-776(-)
MTTKTPHIKLYHFEHHTFGAPGEPIRLALAVGGLQFEDKRIARKGEEWQQLKKAGLCPFEQLPVLVVDEDLVISQSNGILRYVGMLTDLYPVQDPLKAGKVDEILGVIQDFKVRMFPSINQQNLEQKKKMRQRLSVDVLPRWFDYLERALVENDVCFASENGFCIGDKLTIADLALSCFLGWFQSGAFDGIPETILDSYPRLTMVLQSVAAVPKVFHWRKTHETKYYRESDWIASLQGAMSSAGQSPLAQARPS